MNLTGTKRESTEELFRNRLKVASLVACEFLVGLRR